MIYNTYNKDFLQKVILIKLHFRAKKGDSNNFHFLSNLIMI